MDGVYVRKLMLRRIMFCVSEKLLIDHLSRNGLALQLPPPPKFVDLKMHMLTCILQYKINIFAWKSLYFKQFHAKTINLS